MKRGIATFFRVIGGVMYIVIRALFFNYEEWTAPDGVVYKGTAQFIASMQLSYAQAENNRRRAEKLNS